MTTCTKQESAPQHRIMLEDALAAVDRDSVRAVLPSMVPEFLQRARFASVPAWFSMSPHASFTVSLSLFLSLLLSLSLPPSLPLSLSFSLFLPETEESCMTVWWFIGHGHIFSRHGDCSPDVIRVGGQCLVLLQVL